MKKILVSIAIMSITLGGWSQNYIDGSIQQGSAPNKVDILYKASFNSNPSNEYVNSLGIAIGIPASAVAGLGIPTITGVGNFASLSFTISDPDGYDKTLNVQSGGSSGTGNETLRIFSWVCLNPIASTMTWSADVPFVGATITFNSSTTPAQTAKIKLLDLLMEGGGDDGNTLFVISTNAHGDVTHYNAPPGPEPFFFPITGGAGGNNSATGTYTTGDHFVQTNLLITLPVNLLNFSGYKNGAKNTLNWTTAKEINNVGFDVQRSTDGVNYSSVGFVNSLGQSGSSSTEIHYTFDDANPSGKKQYYRLNQKDIDGNSKLSNVVMITRDKPTVLGIGGLFPNPARTSVNVIIDAPQRDKITIVVTDMAGKTVIQQQANVDLGSNTVPVNVAKLSNGSYLVKLLCQSSDCETATSKFNKQ